MLNFMIKRYSSQNATNYGEMKNTRWSIASKDHVNYDDDDDDGNDVNNRVHEEPEEEEEEEEQQTVKPGNTFKSAHQAMIERKMHEADTRGQLLG